MYKSVYLQYNGVVRVHLLKINVLIPKNIFNMIITVESVSFAQKLWLLMLLYYVNHIFRKDRGNHVEEKTKNTE